MKKATYQKADGTPIEVEYDETAPCRICGLPVTSASMGGPDVCPWCDCGTYRDGSRWDDFRPERIRVRAAEIDLQLRNTVDLRLERSYVFVPAEPMKLSKTPDGFWDRLRERYGKKE